MPIMGCIYAKASADIGNPKKNVIAIIISPRVFRPAFLINPMLNTPIFIEFLN